MSQPKHPVDTASRYEPPQIRPLGSVHALTQRGPTGKQGSYLDGFGFAGDDSPVTQTS